MTPMRRLRPVLAAALAVVALGGCSDGRQAIGRTLGLTYDSPDPFNVAPRAPLRLPPDLAALPPPQPGAPSPLEAQPARQAQAALGGVGAAPAGGPSPGELALLDAAGAEAADPAIRTTLTAEENAPRERRYGLTTLFGMPTQDPYEGQRLEQREEAERLLETAPEASVPSPRPIPPREPGRLF